VNSARVVRREGWRNPSLPLSFLSVAAAAAQYNLHKPEIPGLHNATPLAF
ncbi:MAG: hypothetical protein ACI8RA_001218, partial [Chlamydiales bacterium]